MLKRYQITINGTNGVTKVEYYCGVIQAIDLSNCGLSTEQRKHLAENIDADESKLSNIKEHIEGIQISQLLPF